MARSSDRLIDRDLYYKGAPRGPLLDFKAIIFANLLTYLNETLEDSDIIRKDDRGISYWGRYGVFEFYLGSDSVSIRYSEAFPAHRPLLVLFEYLEGYVDIIKVVIEIEKAYADYTHSG